MADYERKLAEKLWLAITMDSGFRERARTIPLSCARDTLPGEIVSALTAALADEGVVDVAWRVKCGVLHDELVLQKNLHAAKVKRLTDELAALRSGIETLDKAVQQRDEQLAALKAKLLGTDECLETWQSAAKKWEAEVTKLDADLATLRGDSDG